MPRLRTPCWATVVVRAFANEPVEIAKFGKGNRDFMDIKKYNLRYMAAFQITTSPLTD